MPKPAQPTTGGRQDDIKCRSGDMKCRPGSAERVACSTFADLLQEPYAAPRARRRGAGSLARPEAKSAP